MMRSKKDSKKLKGILLAIDLLLLSAVLAVGIYCFDWFRAIGEIPDTQYEKTMQELAAREAEIEEKTADMLAHIEKRNAESDAAYAAAAETMAASQAAYDAAAAERDAAQAALDELQASIDEANNMKEKIAALRTEYGQTVRKLEDMIIAGETDYRICYLTFDDGPTYHTPDFLDELEELDVYATFFTIGGGVEEHNYHLRDEYLRREALAGHSIANHTYTHAYWGPLYASVDSFMDAVRDQDEVVYNATGIHTDIVRFPAGSYYCTYRSDTIDALTEEGFGWIDWSGNAYDSGGLGYSSAYTASTVIWQVRQEDISVVLMHDWNRDTLGALESIVTTLREEGYLFLPLFKESSTVGTVYPKWD